MKLHATKHGLVPLMAILAFVIGMSCSPRVHALGAPDCQATELPTV